MNNMTCKFLYSGLEIYTTLGVYEYEKEVRKFYIDVELEVDIGRSFISDNLEDTIDSMSIKDHINTLVSGKTFNLLEKICYDIGKSLISLDNRILSAKIVFHKGEYLKGMKDFSLTMKFSQ